MSCATYWSQPAAPILVLAIRSSSGRGADRRLSQILLLSIGPGHALHIDLDAYVVLLEDIERLAHLRRLGIVEAERDRGIRGHSATGHEAGEGGSRKASNT